MVSQQSDLSLTWDCQKEHRDTRVDCTAVLKLEFILGNEVLLPLWETNQVGSGNGQQVWQTYSDGSLG